MAVCGKRLSRRIPRIAFSVMIFTPMAVGRMEAQHEHSSQIPSRPSACELIDLKHPANWSETEGKAEERNYDAAFNEFMREGCATRGAAGAPKSASDENVAKAWKRLWYRKGDWNTAFHEMGSYQLLLVVGVSHRVPRLLTEDKAFFGDWLDDCSERCFMVYGDDDSSSKKVREQMLRMRDDLIVSLGKDSASRAVVGMLRHAKID